MTSYVGQYGDSYVGPFCDVSYAGCGDYSAEGLSENYSRNNNDSRNTNYKTKSIFDNIDILTVEEAVFINSISKGNLFSYDDYDNIETLIYALKIENAKLFPRTLVVKTAENLDYRDAIKLKGIFKIFQSKDKESKFHDRIHIPPDRALFYLQRMSWRLDSDNIGLEKIHFNIKKKKGYYEYTKRFYTLKDFTVHS